MTASEKPTGGIRDSYTEKYGFHDADQFVFKARKGLDAEIVREISQMKGEPAVDAGVPAQGAGDVPEEAHARLGRRPRARSTSTTSTTTSSRPKTGGPARGTMCRPT